MTFNRMLKFALPMLMLGAASAPYAAAQVKLADGKTNITWAQFADAINNPSKITGTVDRTDLTTAETNYKNAVKAAQDAANAVTTAVNNINTANEAIKTATAGITTAKNAYDAKEAELAGWQRQLSTLNTDLTSYSTTLSNKRAELANYKKDVPFTWLGTILTAAQQFEHAWDIDDASKSLYYKFVSGSVKGNSIYLAFTALPASETGYTQATTAEFLTFLESNTVKNLFVYLGDEYKALNTTTNSATLKVTAYKGDLAYLVSEAVSAIDALSKNPDFCDYADPKAVETLQGEIEAANTGYNNTYAAIEKIKASIKGYTETLTNGKTQQQTLKDAVTAAEAAKTTADNAKIDAEKAKLTAEDNQKKADAEVVVKKEELAAAQAAYDKAVAASSATALANYKTVTLTQDITVDATINSFDGIIYGENHFINMGQGITNAFNNFSGKLSKAAVNGEFAKDHNGAGFANVAFWDGNMGTAFDAYGKVTPNIATIGELGYHVRNVFGVDFSANKLVALNNNTKVYSVSLYNVNSITQHYVVKNGTILSDANGTFTIPENRFVKSETRDLTGIANVFYADNSCPEVVITDRKDFYCPVDLQAANVTYERAFNSGKNAVCLPFDLHTNINSDINFVATYEKEDATKFWFKKIAASVAAYTPALVDLASPLTGFTLSNTIVKATPANQIVVDEGDMEAPCKAYGLLKPATPDEFKGASSNYRIYGCTKEGTFKRVPNTKAFDPLRTVIYGGFVNAAPAKARAMGDSYDADEKAIGILEENGTTAIEAVGTDAEELTIVGQQGEILFTSAASYSNVEIYNLSGALAAVVDVAEGTSSVSLPAGIYIVMGKKIQVK